MVFLTEIIMTPTELHESHIDTDPGMYVTKELISQVYSCLSRIFNKEPAELPQPYAAGITTNVLQN